MAVAVLASGSADADQVSGCCHALGLDFIPVGEER